MTEDEKAFFTQMIEQVNAKMDDLLDRITAVRDDLTNPPPQKRLDMEHIEQMLRWTPYKALAAIVAACAAITGVILALSHFIH